MPLAVLTDLCEYFKDLYGERKINFRSSILGNLKIMIIFVALKLFD